jgi:hypothetical protein
MKKPAEAGYLDGERITVCCGDASIRRLASRRSIPLVRRDQIRPV